MKAITVISNSPNFNSIAKLLFSYLVNTLLTQYSSESVLNVLLIFCHVTITSDIHKDIYQKS